MKQTMNKIAPAAATDEPAVPSTYKRPGSLHPRPIHEDAPESVDVSGWEMLSGRAVRHDGWTPERIGCFLRALGATGCVTTSARAAGMTKQAAYTLRNSTKACRAPGRGARPEVTVTGGSR